MIALDNVGVRNGSFALSGVSLAVPRGGYAVLMGPTGSGKTTLLEAICGLKAVVGGCIRLNGDDVTAWKPASRGIGYVPQDGALFPTMTVRQNMGFGLVVRKAAARAIAARVAELAAWLGLVSLLDRRPQGLSGGEKQRVVLGRALAIQPAVLLLDEPLSALDDQTRADLCDLLRRLRQQWPVTVLHVTHNLEDAQRLGDSLWVLERGVVCQRPEMLAATPDGVPAGGPRP